MHADKYLNIYLKTKGMSNLFNLNILDLNHLI